MQPEKPASLLSPSVPGDKMELELGNWPRLGCFKASGVNERKVIMSVKTWEKVMLLLCTPHPMMAGGIYLVIHSQVLNGLPTANMHVVCL